MKMTDRSYKTRPTQRRKFSWSMAKMRDESGSAAVEACLLYTSPSPRDRQKSRMPSSA